MVNIITIHAIRKTSSLPKALKTLLLSLAVSDLAAGLLGQPLYIVFLDSLLKPNTENNSLDKATKVAFSFVANLLSYALFFSVAALTFDRFLSIHLHLRYQELVTHKRVVAVVISIWVVSAFLALFWFFVPPTKGNFVATIATTAAIDTVCLVTTALLYFKIYLAVRHHRNQIQSLQVQQEALNSEMANVARLEKSAVGTFYVYFVFFICYLPQDCIYFAVLISGLNDYKSFVTLHSDAGVC